MRLPALVAVGTVAAAALAITTTTCATTAAGAVQVLELKQWSAAGCAGTLETVGVLYGRTDGCTPQGSMSGGLGVKINCTAATYTAHVDATCAGALVQSSALNTCARVPYGSTNATFLLQCVDVNPADVYTYEAFADAACSQLYAGVSARFNSCELDLVSGDNVRFAPPTANGSIVVSTFASNDLYCDRAAVSTKTIRTNVCTRVGNEPGNATLYYKITAGLPWAPAPNATTNGTKSPTRAPSGASAQPHGSLVSVVVGGVGALAAAVAFLVA